MAAQDPAPTTTATPPPPTHPDTQISPASPVSRKSSIAKRVFSGGHSRGPSTATNGEAGEIRPSDVLIERFLAWKDVVKQLLGYFEAMAEVQSHTGKHYEKASGTIEVPFRTGGQHFLEQGGLQELYRDVRESTRAVADQHYSLARTIQGSVIERMTKLKADIKAHIKNIENDSGKLADILAKERTVSSRLISDLSNHVTTFNNTPNSVTNKTDPFVTNLAVANQMRRQIHQENLFQQSILAMQTNSAQFEENIVKTLQSVWQTFNETQTRTAVAISGDWRQLTVHVDSLPVAAEWKNFITKGAGVHLAKPDAPTRDINAITYPKQHDPSVNAIRKGHLERKKQYTRTYAERYFVLSAAGFLHEYAGSQECDDGVPPEFSLFLPACNLGPPSNSSAKSHKFFIEGKKGGDAKKSMSLSKRFSLGGRRKHAWSFKTKHRADLLLWYEEIKKFCSEDRELGPVQDAVRGAGIADDSLEPVDSDDEDYASASETDRTSPPSYDGDSGIDVAYSERKHHPKEKSTAGSVDEGANVARRPSKRQLEKAPEGKPPHVHYEDEHQGVKSHFVEGV